MKKTVTEIARMAFDRGITTKTLFGRTEVPARKMNSQNPKIKERFKCITNGYLVDKYPDKFQRLFDFTGWSRNGREFYALYPALRSLWNGGRSKSYDGKEEVPQHSQDYAKDQIIALSTIPHERLVIVNTRKERVLETWKTHRPLNDTDDIIKAEKEKGVEVITVDRLPEAHPDIISSFEDLPSVLPKSDKSTLLVWDNNGDKKRQTIAIDTLPKFDSPVKLMTGKVGTFKIENLQKLYAEIKMDVTLLWEKAAHQFGFILISPQ